MTSCRPPRRHVWHRMEPSERYPHRCDCGYHFRSIAEMDSHKAAFDRIEDEREHPLDLLPRAA